MLYGICVRTICPVTYWSESRQRIHRCDDAGLRWTEGSVRRRANVNGRKHGLAGSRGWQAHGVWTVH
jgi:hypothetical protein